MKNSSDPADLSGAWRASLLVFVLAALTGAALRFRLAGVDLTGMLIPNLRHAHTHLMYFGWVVPAFFALAAQPLLRTDPNAASAVRWWLGVTFAAALLTYPLFLAYGYTPAVIGERRLPLAVIASALNLVPWAGFGLLYARHTRDTTREPEHLIRIALGFLICSMAPAAALALRRPLGLDHPSVTDALTHSFLHLFTEGWLVFVLLGVMTHSLGVSMSPWRRRGLVAAVLLSTPLSWPLALLPAAVQAGAQVAGVAGSVLLVGYLAGLWRSVRPQGAEGTWHLRVPLLMMGLKAAGLLGVSLWVGLPWRLPPGMRILYLHVMLLGGVSLGAIGVARALWGTRAGRGVRLAQAAVGVMLLSLVPLTGFWPAAWSGLWTHLAAAGASVLPVLAFAGVAATAFRAGHEPRSEGSETRRRSSF